MILTTLSKLNWWGLFFGRLNSRCISVLWQTKVAVAKIPIFWSRQESWTTARWGISEDLENVKLSEEIKKKHAKMALM
jgi:hypothetical protein